jgi:hypothetical protein
MPRLGEAVEPAKGEAARPWWREADAPPRQQAKPAEPEDPGKMPKAMPWPLD